VRPAFEGLHNVEDYDDDDCFVFYFLALFNGGDHTRQTCATVHQGGLQELTVQSVGILKLYVKHKSLLRSYERKFLSVDNIII
jgi:hypothetical protein